MLNDEINEIRRLSGLSPMVIEAAPSASRLLPMFQGVLDIAPDDLKSDLKRRVQSEIEWARNTLKREDRVIWYLRFMQLAFLEKIGENVPEAIDVLRKKLQQFSNKSKQPVGKIAVVLSDFISGSVKQSLTHYLSMPITGIQTLIFTWQLPQDIISAFEELEKEWKDDQSRTVPYNPNLEVVIDFGDGYAWYNLETAYCSDEARAMGHCGNSPRQRSSDTILSLRRTQKVGGETILTPVLTFILDDNGLLGEMKGRGNDKPAEKYHPYIIKLLLHDIVNGIKGGGYLAQNNFSLNDLDEDVKDELLEKKPELAGPIETINKLMNEGNIESGIAAITNLVSEHDLATTSFRVEKGEDNSHWTYWRAALDEWSDHEHIANAFDDKPVGSLYDALEQLGDLKLDQIKIEDEMTPDLVSRVIEKLPLPQQNALFDGLNLTYENNVARADAIEDATTLMLRDQDNNRFYRYLQDAITDVAMHSKFAGDSYIETVKKEILDRLKEYADAGYPAEPYEVEIGPDDSSNWQNGTWVAALPLGTILDIIEAGIEGEYGHHDEYYYHYLTLRQDGVGISHDNLSEDRSEHGHSSHLTAFDETDPLADQVEENIFALETDGLADEISKHFAERILMREDSEHDLVQFLEESFDQDYLDIMRLAGVST